MDLLTRAPRTLGRVRRRLLLHRRGLAALCAAWAVLVGLQAAAPAPPATTPVWTAARDLPGGEVIGRDDLRLVQFAPDTAPSGRAAREELVGRTLVAPLVRGAPLSDRSVLGEGLLAGHPGLAAVPIRLTDPDVVRLLRVGDRVDLLAVAADRPDTARTVVTDALVLAIPQGRSEQISTGLSGRIVVLGVTPENAGKVVAAHVTALVTAVLTR